MRSDINGQKSTDGLFGLFYPVWFQRNTGQIDGQNFGPVTLYPAFFQPMFNPMQIYNSQNVSVEVKPEGRQPQKLKEKLQNSESGKWGNNQRSSEGKMEVVQEKEKMSKKKKLYIYKTEKSFYLSQKLKGKMRLNCRILRERKDESAKIESTNNLIKNKLRMFSKKNKGKKIGGKQKVTNKNKQAKSIQKELKVKARKNAGCVVESHAEIPKLISGAVEFNDYLTSKLMSLQLRRISLK